MTGMIPEDGIQVEGGWVEMIQSPTFAWICGGCGARGPIQREASPAGEGLIWHRTQTCPNRSRNVEQEEATHVNRTLH